jgi:DNA-directed RNA polymerase subunit beta'
LVDVSQDVIINEEDCGTLRGFVATALKKMKKLLKHYTKEFLGRTTVHDIYHPLNRRVNYSAGEEITEEIVK